MTRHSNVASALVARPYFSTLELSRHFAARWALAPWGVGVGLRAQGRYWLLRFGLQRFIRLHPPRCEIPAARSKGLLETLSVEGGRSDSSSAVYVQRPVGTHTPVARGLTQGSSTSRLYVKTWVESRSRLRLRPQVPDHATVQDLLFLAHVPEAEVQPLALHIPLALPVPQVLPSAMCGSMAQSISMPCAITRPISGAPRPDSSQRRCPLFASVVSGALFSSGVVPNAKLWCGATLCEPSGDRGVSPHRTLDVDRRR
jgi:hypothetical protein